MSAIEIKNLTYVYSPKTPFEKVALSDINLSIEEGQFVGIVGATGSGKSTLIQHLNGLVKVQDKKKSSVVVNGMSATDKKTLKNLRFEVGMVFQYPEYQLFADTVEKDVAFGPKNMKLEKDEIDRRVRRAIEVVGLDYDAFAHRSPFDLSGGEKRRVAIAGVIAMDPDVLILDEPTAGLDPQGRDTILAQIQAYHRAKGAAVVLVSHSMEEIARNVDRIVVLSDGKVYMEGTPKQVFARAHELEQVGLDVPQVTKVAAALKARGLDIDTAVYTVEALEQKLLTLRGGASPC